MAAVKFWAEALWAGEPDLRTMIDAWRYGKQGRGGVGTRCTTARAGVVAAYLGAVERLG